MTFTESEINAIVRDDQDMETVLPRDYSPIIHDALRNNYHNARTRLIMAPGRYCSEIQVRLANMRPVQYDSYRNYWPSLLGENLNFVQFVKSALITQFASRRTCVRVNFSISLLILDPNDTNSPTHFLWSSRGNFACLDVAFSIHSWSTLNEFIEDVVAPYSVENALMRKLETLEERYSGELIPISVNFYITLNTNTIFGARKTYNQRYLSDNECVDKETCNRNTDCVWNALSSMVTLDNERRPIVRHCLRKRVNKRIAKRLKVQFLRWYRTTKFKGDYFSDPVTAHGFDASFFSILEKFLKMGIVLVDNTQITKKKVGFFGLVNTNSKMRCLKVKFASKERRAETIYLSTDGRNHIQCITNLPMFAHKFTCKGCAKSYRYACELKRHNCKQAKFGGSTQQKWIYSLHKSIEKTLSVENRLKSDAKYMHVLINEMGVDGGISVKMHFHLFGSDILTKAVVTPDLQCATQIIVKYCTRAALIVLSERMAKNFSLLKTVENECNGITIKSDPIQVENLLRVKQGLVEFLSSFACYIQTGHGDSLTSNVVMHTLVSTLSDDNDCNNFAIRFARNMLQGVYIKGNPVRYLNLGEFAPNYMGSEACDSHVTDWSLVIAKFEEYFGLNITGLSPGQIGHQLLANNLTCTEKKMFMTSTVAFQERTFHENVRYGLLSFQESGIVSQNASFKSVISSDYSKFYFSILTSPNPDDFKWLTVGLPIRYEEQKRDGVFVAERTRRRKTMANLFLRLVEEMFDTTVVSLINSREMKFDSKPVDGYFQLNGETWVTEYCGCGYHGVGESSCDDDEAVKTHNGVCHLPKSFIRTNYPGHSESCDVCKADECSDSYNFAKPSLWHLRDGEDLNSMHFFRKGCSYRDLFEQTKEKNTSIKNCGFKLLVVYECTILKYWNRTVGDFFAQWQLPVKGTHKSEVLGKMMGQICNTAFPLSRYPYLTESRIVESVKTRVLNGFVTITCNLGPKSAQVLGAIKPFFFRDKQGNPVQSFDIEKRTVSTCLLHELLTNPSFVDFTVIKIHEAFEFTVPRTNPFEKLRSPVKIALSNEGSCTFTKLVKATINRAVGSLNYNCTKRVKSILIKEDDIAHLNSQNSNLSHCTRVTADKVLMHLKNRRAVSNSSHLHLGILATGVSAMLRYLCGMKQFLTGAVFQRCNTDGVVVKFETEHFHESLTVYSDLSLVFDAFLPRDNLSTEMLNGYITWKKTYFKHLGFCPNHEKVYMDFLLKNDTCFNPMECCRKFVNNDTRFCMIVEFTGNMALFKSVNALIIVNTYNFKRYAKGVAYQSFDCVNLAGKSCDELKLML